MDHPLLKRRLAPLAATVAEASALAERAARDEGAEHGPDAYRVYQCGKCASCFSGGLRQCEAAGDEDERAVLCEECREKKGSKCPKHGSKFCVKKCNYCCQVATFVCAGGYHQYCTSCHIGAAEAFHRGKWNEWHKQHQPRVPACDPLRCPFGGAHPAGHTNCWRSPCTECHKMPAAAAAAAQPAVTRVRTTCESPGCKLLGHAEPAPWNGWGRHCCAGCMHWASNATMRPNAWGPPGKCHDSRCCKGP